MTTTRIEPIWECVNVDGAPFRAGYHDHSRGEDIWLREDIPTAEEADAYSRVAADCYVRGWKAAFEALEYVQSKLQQIST